MNIDNRPKVSINIPPPQPPPKPTVTITLSWEQLGELVSIIGHGRGLVGGLYDEIDAQLLKAGHSIFSLSRYEVLDGEQDIVLLTTRRR